MYKGQPVLAQGSARGWQLPTELQGCWMPWGRAVPGSEQSSCCRAMLGGAHAVPTCTEPNVHAAALHAAPP